MNFPSEFTSDFSCDSLNLDICPDFPSIDFYIPDNSQKYEDFSEDSPIYSLQMNICGRRQMQDRVPIYKIFLNFFEISLIFSINFLYFLNFLSSQRFLCRKHIFSQFSTVMVPQKSQSYSQSASTNIYSAALISLQTRRQHCFLRFPH